MNRAEELFEKIVANGEAAIYEFIANRAAEELFLDFKRSSDDGKGKKLSDNDRNNLAKSLSGFSNSEGGVIVWGVDCSKDPTGADVAKAKIPIENPKRFLSWIENAISGCTVPPAERVRNHAIIIPSTDTGFVITLIPKSEITPHQVSGECKYYIRAGSNFLPTPHQVLAGMFGRRPQPNLVTKFLHTPPEVTKDGIWTRIEFAVRNIGGGIAADVYFNFFCSPRPGEKCKIELLPVLGGIFEMNELQGIHVNGISKKGFRLPSQSFIKMVALQVLLMPPFTRNFKLDGSIGCRNAPLKPFSFNCSRETIQELYDETTHEKAVGALKKQEAEDFIERLFGHKLGEG